MRSRIPDAGLAQTIGWIWLAFVLVGLVAFLGYRWWRRRHPAQRPAPELSYSQRLTKRMSQRPAATNPKRRKRPVKSRVRRH